jgi:hypothetical protein
LGRLDGIITGLAPATAEDLRTGMPDAVYQARWTWSTDRQTGAAVARPAIGSRAHEGLRFDSKGILYGISETGPGYIYRFVPDRPGDLSSGQLYALKVADASSRTGPAEWVPLPSAASQANSVSAAAAAGATGWSRPEDVEIGDHTLYVAITGENLVLAIDLRAPAGGGGHATALVATTSGGRERARGGQRRVHLPDNLALDPSTTSTSPRTRVALPSRARPSVTTSGGDRGPGSSGSRPAS